MSAELAPNLAFKGVMEAGSNHIGFLWVMEYLFFYRGDYEIVIASVLGRGVELDP